MEPWKWNPGTWDPKTWDGTLTTETLEMGPWVLETIIIIIIVIIILPYQRNTLQTLLFKLFDKLIR